MSLPTRSGLDLWLALANRSQQTLEFESLYLTYSCSSVFSLWEGSCYHVKKPGLPYWIAAERERERDAGNSHLQQPVGKAVIDLGHSWSASWKSLYWVSSIWGGFSYGSNTRAPGSQSLGQWQCHHWLPFPVLLLGTSQMKGGCLTWRCDQQKLGTAIPALMTTGASWRFASPAKAACQHGQEGLCLKLAGFSYFNCSSGENFYCIFNPEIHWPFTPNSPYPV